MKESRTIYSYKIASNCLSIDSANRKTERR